jgi:hypothetical protein
MRLLAGFANDGRQQRCHGHVAGLEIVALVACPIPGSRPSGIRSGCQAICLSREDRTEVETDAAEMRRATKAAPRVATTHYRPQISLTIANLTGLLADVGERAMRKGARQAPVSWRGF